MQYDELNPHFRERIRERVSERLAQSDAAIDTNTRDVIVLAIILLADENNLPRAAERLFEMKRTDEENSITHDDAMIWITKTFELFPTEVAILSDLYRMQERQEDIVDIIAHTEMRLLEK